MHIHILTGYFIFSLELSTSWGYKEKERKKEKSVVIYHYKDRSQANKWRGGNIYSRLSYN